MRFLKASLPPSSSSLGWRYRPASAAGAPSSFLKSSVEADSPGLLELQAGSSAAASASVSASRRIRLKGGRRPFVCHNRGTPTVPDGLGALPALDSRER